MWTPTTREHYNRRAMRYQSDLTDAEWRVIEPLLPPAQRTGRPRAWPLREIVNAIYYVMRGEIAWRLLPSDFPPWSMACRWFAAWRDSCLFERINHSLVTTAREPGDRQASPSAAIIDSQSVKTTKGLRAARLRRDQRLQAPCPGRHRRACPYHRAVSGQHPGSRWRRALLAASRPIFPFIERAFADAGYNHERVTAATAIIVETVRKLPDQVGFAVLPRRRVVQRFSAWIGHNRRFAKDFEAAIASAQSLLFASSTMLLVRRIARAS